jgi:subtilisin family serine protease
MRRTICTGLITGLVVLSAAAETAAAQSSETARQRLEKLLERRLPGSGSGQPAGTRAAPATRSAFPPPAEAVRRPAPTRAPRPTPPSEIIVITPGGKIQRAPARPAPDRRSAMEAEAQWRLAEQAQEDDAYSLSSLWRRMRSWWAPSGTEEPLRMTAAADAMPLGGSPRPALRVAPPQRLAESKRMRSAQPFGVVPDTYIVQFKYSATAEEVDAVLDKYNLNIVGGMPKLGIVLVQRRETRTRSITGGGQSGPHDAGEVLEPAFLRRLRREPGVNAATVQATIAPKSIPRPSSTKVDDAGRAYYWTWRPGVTDDGNWGLKRMRLPTVWRILESYRARGSEPVRMSFLDSGFTSLHPHIKWRHIHGLQPGERLFALDSTCAESHGTHVAGIAGAAHGLGRGIDGIVPNAALDAIPLQGDGVLLGVEAGIDNPDSQNFLLFTTALGQLTDYLDTEPAPAGGRRVVNISLGHNWRATSIESNTPVEDKFANGDLAKQYDRTFILSLAQILRQSFKKYEKDTLFVVAAGNDSEGLVPPLNAKWSSPFAFLGLENSLNFHASPNVLVVEAADRTGGRASFSNAGGHVAAPGVDVMSTIGGRKARYGICEGTSQAAPHVTALAAILMEIAPEKTPAEIAQIIRTSAVPDPTGSVAPRVDALEAVLAVRSDALTVLADLNGDGNVDADDLATYRRHRQAMTTVFRSTLGSYFLDLNDNGEIEDNEHWWPRIDLNGSGLADLNPGDDAPRCIEGKPATDLDVIRDAWQGGDMAAFDSAVAEFGLAQQAASATESAARESARESESHVSDAARSTGESSPATDPMSRLSASHPPLSHSEPAKPRCSW